MGNLLLLSDKNWNYEYGIYVYIIVYIILLLFIKFKIIKLCDFLKIIVCELYW